MARLSLTLLLLLTAGARLVRADVLTLPEAERRALLNDAALASRAKTAQAAADLEAARSGQHPTVALSTDASIAPGGQLVDLTAADGQHFLVQGSRSIGESGAFVPVPRFGGVVSLQANLFDFGRTASRIAAAEHRVRSSMSEEQAVKEENARAARDAYLAWTVAHARVALVEQRVMEVRDQAAQVRGSIQEGARPPADENVARQEQIAVGIELSEARGELQRAELALRQIVGDPWKTSFVPDLTILEVSPAGATDAAALDAAALEEQAEAASALAESLAHDHAPVLSASGDVGVRGQATSVFPAYHLGMLLTIPIWDGGLGAAQARAAQAQAAGLRAEARSLSSARRTEQQLASDEVSRARERSELAQQLRQLAEEEVAQVNERYRLGAVDLRAVVEVRERLWRAEVQELTAKAARTRAALSARP